MKKICEECGWLWESREIDCPKCKHDDEEYDGGSVTPNKGKKDDRD